MKFLARIQGDDYGGAREVLLVPHARRYALHVRPRPPLHALIAATLPGLAAPTPAEIQAWLARECGEAGINELRPHLWRRAELADFMDAVNADAFIDATRDWNIDAVTAFARDRGGDLLAEVRAELEGDARVARVAERARRFVQIVGLPEAHVLLDELARLHDVEHLMALEHALVRWVGSASMSRAVELAALGRELPDEDASAGISDEWFGWWWRLARATTRAGLATAVDAVIAHVDAACGGGRVELVATDARQWAHEMAAQMRSARHASLWSTPYDERVAVKTVVRDGTDAHYVAFMAVSHAAHALAYELGRRLSPSAANRTAMKTLAQVALAALRDPTA